MRPDPENIHALLLTARCVDRPKRVENVAASFDKILPSSEFLDFSLHSIAVWCEKKGQPAMAQRCRALQKEKESFRRKTLLPFILSLRQSKALAKPIYDNPLYYLCLREIWKDRHDEENAALGKQLAALPETPRISILMPVYNPKPKFLREALDSVLAQSYPHWELCLADDASTDSAVAEVLRTYCAQDARIKLTRRETNGHICAASNTALELATGAYAALMDHDDILDANALARVALALAKAPQCRILYSDEDKLNAPGYHSNVYFKPGYDPDLLCAQNYFSHLTVYATDLLRKVGGFTPGLEGSQDHDLALRCTALVKARQIVHLPHVLYHWRIHEDSTAQGYASKPYASEAGLQTVIRHLEGQGQKAHVEVHRRCLTHYRVRTAPPLCKPPILLFTFCEERSRAVDRWASLLTKKSAYSDLTLHIFYTRGQQSLEYNEKLCHRPYDVTALHALIAGAPEAVVGSIGCGLTPFEPDWLDNIMAEALRPEVGAVGGRIWSQQRVLESAGLGISQGRIFAEHAGLKHHAYCYFNQPHLLRAVAFLPEDYLFARAPLFTRFAQPSSERLWSFSFCMQARAQDVRILCSPESDVYRMSGYAAAPLPAPDDADMAAFASQWQEDLTAISLHPVLTPVSGGYALAELLPALPCPALP